MTSEVHRLWLEAAAPAEPSIDRARDRSNESLATLFATYVRDQVTVELESFGGEGVNLDVGETKDFNLCVTNHGSLDLSDLTIEIESARGRLSNWCTSGSTYWDPEKGCVVGWTDPWQTKLVFDHCAIGPGVTWQGSVPPYIVGQSGCRRLFGYRADEPTAGADNDRDVEALITARVVSGRIAMSETVVTKYGAHTTFDAFIQRS